MKFVFRLHFTGMHYPQNLAFDNWTGLTSSKERKLPCDLLGFLGPQIVFHTGASSLEKSACCRRAAFAITVQHKPTLSLDIRNWLNFAMLPKYHISSIPPTYSTL